MGVLWLIGPIGWVLGIIGFVQARRALAEIARLRGELAHQPPQPFTTPAPPVIPAEQPLPPPAPAIPPIQAEPSPAFAQAMQHDQPEEPQAQRPPPPPPRPPAPPPPSQGVDLEALLTMRWGVWLGAVALVMAGVFLVRYAAEQGLLGPGPRCALAGLLGLALIAGAEWVRRWEDVPAGIADHAAPALAAGGVAVLFGAGYGAGVLYALVPPLVGFGLLAAASLTGLALSLRHGQLVAAVGIVGAFVTPALVQTDNPSLPGLFCYLLFVTAAALAVVRYTAWIWLGWGSTIAGAIWVLLTLGAGVGTEAWAPALFVPAAAALNLALLPAEALDHEVGRRLAWIPVATLGITGLLLATLDQEFATRGGVLLLTPVTIAKAAREPRLRLLPFVAATLFLLLLVGWSIDVHELPDFTPPSGHWTPSVVRALTETAAFIAGCFAASGLWFERRTARPLAWSSLAASVPVLALAICYARVAGFSPRLDWGAVALLLAAGLTGAAAAALREQGGPADALGEQDGAATGLGDQGGSAAALGQQGGSDASLGEPDGSAAASREQHGSSADQAINRARAGVHAAGAVAALALGCAMMLREHWLTLALSLFLPMLAWVAAKVELPALRKVALAVASVVLIRLLLNWYVIDYAFGGLPETDGLLLAYGVPAAAFALAAAMFVRQGDDLTVGALEAGSVAFVTVLVALEIRNAAIPHTIDTPVHFAEAAEHVASLAILAVATMRIATRLNRPVLHWGWRIQGGMAIAGGVLLILANPIATGEPVGHAPLIDWLLPAYLLPACLAVLALRQPATAQPEGLRHWLAGYGLLAGFAWITLEVRHLFHPAAMQMPNVPVSDAELWSWSGAWLAYGAALMAVGIRTGKKPLRLAALAIIGLTAAKVFLVDMSGMVGLWRVVSFLGLGLTLISLGAVYRRFVATGDVAAHQPPNGTHSRTAS